MDQQLIDGRYARVEQIGRGGFGIVWRAHDTLLERDVAIKEVHFPAVLRDQEQAELREKVLREARAAARLSHPALVTVFDVVEENGRPFIIMELVDAPTLAQRVATDGPLSDREAAAVGEQVLDALATAHAQGIVHRDVKPANVMVSPSGRAQLGDFGIASIIDDPKVTSSGQLAGSPSYMAPEQAHNQPAGPATDLWGLAATLYFAVEGEPPFEKDGPIPTLTSVVNDDPRPMQRATTLAPLLTDVLVKDPDQRPSVEDVRRRLAEIVAGSVAVPEPAPSPTLILEPELLEAELAEAELAEAELAEAELAEAEPPPAAAVPRAQAAEALADEAPSASPPPPPPPPAPAPPVVSRPRRDLGRGSRAAPLLPLALVVLLVVVLVAVVAGRDDSPTSTTQADRPGVTEPAQQTQQAEQAQQAEEADDDEPEPAQDRRQADDRPAVAGQWQQYEDPVTGFTISYPRGWVVQREGTLTDFRDPVSAAYLRVDYTTSPGPSAEQAWLDFEPRFAAENPDYRRIRIVPTTFKGYPGAIWEFTYTGLGVPLHAIDLGFVTGPYGFALNFQTRAEDWDRMQGVFEAFQESFQPPPG